MEPFKPVQPVNPEDLERTGEILKSVSGKNRLYTYIQLYQDNEPKHIAQDLDITRNAVQHYITDWKEDGLVNSENRNYEFTELGEAVVEQLEGLHAGITFTKQGVEFDIDEISDDRKQRVDFFSSPVDRFPTEDDPEQT